MQSNEAASRFKSNLGIEQQFASYTVAELAIPEKRI